MTLALLLLSSALGTILIVGLSALKLSGDAAEKERFATQAEKCAAVLREKGR